MQHFILLMVMLAGGMAAGAANLLAADVNKLDMRLIPKGVVETSDGCSFALWQQDRDPKKDKFAYAFYVGFHDAHPMPGLIKVGKKVVKVEKIDPGFDNSTVTDKVQLYRSADKNITVVLELIDVKTEGYKTIVDKARLTFVQRGKLPFVMTAKGGFACEKQKMAAKGDSAVPDEPETTGLALPPNLDPNGIKLSPGKPFAKLKQVPAHIAKLAVDAGEACDVTNTPGAGMSFAVSEAMTLWQLPCALHASNASAVFVAALNGTPHATLLKIPDVPGKGAGAPSYDVLNAVVAVERGVLTSSNINAAGNCGTIDTYQLVESGGESIGFKLLERREKSECAGSSMEPGQFPLTYRAK